jgi:hypothetical protein
MADETEKQEGQKTVVAFIAGLLIGGLLVWVFSSSPEGTPANVNTATDSEAESEMTDDTSENTTNTTRTNENVIRETPQSSSQPTTAVPTGTQSQVGDGALSASNQGAGTLVVLSDVEYPANAGWIVVRDYEDQTPGRILGAARFNVTDGLVPETVTLLRGTEAGATYQVVFYNENGDRVFDLADDTLVDGISATFTAQ